MPDRPSFRILPPIALSGPLVVGVCLTAAFGDGVVLPRTPTRIAGAVLCVVFVCWNGWTLWVMAGNRTAVLPGGSTRVMLTRGPFAVSRNPLYLGLITLDIGLALVWPSMWGLMLVPLGVWLLYWGAVVPEERYLAAKFGTAYDDYRRRVRRWL